MSYQFIVNMTEKGGVCPEIISQSNKTEENNNVFIIEGATDDDTSDYFEQTDSFRSCSGGETSKVDTDAADESDVIHSFMQNTSDEVRFSFDVPSFSSTEVILVHRNSK